MIKENQALLNRIHILSDGAIVYLTLPAAFWIRFYILPDGIITVPLSRYLILGVFLTVLQLFACAALGLYRSFRRTRLRRELSRLWLASALVMALLLSFLFVQRYIDFSRLTLAIYFVLNVGTLTCKRILLRRLLRGFRQMGHNQKHVLILGSGRMARAYLEKVQSDRELGYHADGYVAARQAEAWELPYLGGFESLLSLLEGYRPDEVVSAIEPEDYQRTPQIIEDCEKAGVKLSIIPFYAQYMSSNPYFDDLDGIPLMNIRRIPLDNWAHAFSKRALDIAGSLALIVLTSPLMLHAGQRRPGHPLERRPGRAENGLWRADAQVLVGRAPPVLQRAEGGDEPGGPPAGDPLLRGALQGGHPPLHGQAPGPPRHHGLGPGQRPAGGHLHQGPDRIRRVLHRALEPAL